MRLSINLPTRVFLDTRADKVTAMGPAGGFTLLPRHIDFATALVPGLLAWTEEDREHFAAVAEGILVKLGDEVLVSVRAATGGELGELREAVRGMVEDVDEHEQAARSAVARLEASFMRRFLEFGKRG